MSHMLPSPMESCVSARILGLSSFDKTFEASKRLIRRMFFVVGGPHSGHFF